MPLVEESKGKLDTIIKKARVDLYKPVQIAEVLRRSRLEGDIDIWDVDSYKNRSTHWRNDVTRRLIHKVSTSSAKYQHDVWNPDAMPPEHLSVLDVENKRTDGGVERYIYFRFGERQDVISTIISFIEGANPDNFDVDALLKLFVRNAGIKRSVDKAYEIVAYALFETVIETLEATVTVRIPESNREILEDFTELAKVLLGVLPENMQWTQPAHLYRVGVTNASDRGLDMWANFGPAVQVKHLTLNSKAVGEITNKIESDNIVVVCQDAHAEVFQTILMQIEWGRKVRGIVKQSDLVAWYERCLRGKYADKLAKPLLLRLSEGFRAEFPQAHGELLSLIEERGYHELTPTSPWLVAIDSVAPSPNSSQ